MKFSHEMRKMKCTHTQMLFTHPHVVADMYGFLLRNTHVINPQNNTRHTCLERVRENIYPLIQNQNNDSLL